MQQAALLRPCQLACPWLASWGNVCSWSHSEQQRQGLPRVPVGNVTPCRKVKGAGLPSSVITELLVDMMVATVFLSGDGQPKQTG